MHDGFADHLLAFGAEGFQIAVIATFQHPLAVAHVDGVGRAIDQRVHELELVIEGALNLLPLFDLATHVGVPGQEHEQYQAAADHQLV
ncbi:hypothetical protein D3C78_1790170 [compost metagenome]